MKRIVDTGWIVALLVAADKHHAWADAELRKYPPPWFTCEAVLVEAAYRVQSPQTIARMVSRGILAVDFSFQAEAEALTQLCEKYAGRMDIADACVVRMAELTRHCRIWTVDRKDFTVYRRYGNQEIPCEFPPVE